MTSSGAFTRRSAVAADIPFIGMIEEIASTPPFPVSMWTGILSETGTSVRAFLEAMYGVGASRWGDLQDFVILEREGARVAACAVYPAAQVEDDRRTLRLDRFPALAAALGWSRARSDAFLQAYAAAWGDETSFFLTPISDFVIESVGVVPEARGMGAAKELMQAAFDKARAGGGATIGVSVVNGNDAARQLYEGIGFAPFATFHPAAFADGFPGFVKLRRSL